MGVVVVSSETGPSPGLYENSGLYHKKIHKKPKKREGSESAVKQIRDNKRKYDGDKIYKNLIELNSKKKKKE